MRLRAQENPLADTRPRLILAGILVLFFIAAAGSCFTLPDWQSSDEPFHYYYVKILLHEHRLPSHQETYQAAHPPVYYGLAALWALPFKSADAGFLDNWIRLLSVFLGLGTLGFVYLIGRDGTGSAWAGVCMAALVAGNPAFLALSSVVSNDSCVFFACACAIWLMIKSAHSGGGVKSAALCGLAAGLCCLTKISSTILIPFFFVYYCFHPDVRARGAVSAAAEFAMFCGAALVLCSWWFILGYLRIGDKVLFNPVSALNPNPLYIPENFLWFMKMNMLNFWLPMDYLRGGPAGAPMAIKAGYFGASCLGLLLVLRSAIRVFKQENPRARHLVAASAAACLVFLVQMCMFNMKVPVAQARYAFTILGPVTLLAAISLKDIAGKWFPHTTVAVAIAGLGMNMVWAFVCFAGMAPLPFHIP